MDCANFIAGWQRYNYQHTESLQVGQITDQDVSDGQHVLTIRLLTKSARFTFSQKLQNIFTLSIWHLDFII